MHRVQRCYLTAELLDLLRRDTGIVPWTLEQHQDEAVVIPAGCPHQACWWSGLCMNPSARQLMPLP